MPNKMYLIRFNSKEVAGKFYMSDGREINTGIYEKCINHIYELTMEEQDILFDEYKKNEERLNRITKNILDIIK